ncbi:Rhs family protein [Candidatus Burkholderia humilis]|nr:Rhs family protein [Candidatus Burkholderia humilis]
MNPAAFGSLPGSACTQGTAGSFGPDRITAYSYDGAGQLTRLTSGYGVNGLQRDELSYVYNPNGTVATLGDARGNVTTYYYDGLDRLSKTVFLSPSAAGQGNPNDYEQLSLDADGNVTARRLRDGRTISYGYDTLSRRTSMTFPATGISQDSNVSYGYDLQGHLLQAQDANTRRGRLQL